MSACESMNRRFAFTFADFVAWHMEDVKAEVTPDAAGLRMEQLLTAWSHMDDNPDIAEMFFFGAVRRHYMDAFPAY